MAHARFVLLLSFMLVVLSGCFLIEQEIDLSDGGPGALVTTRLEVDKEFAGAEMDLFLDSLELSVPGLTTQATHSRYEVSEDFSDRMVYVWEGHAKAVGNFKLTQRDDGSYEFRYPLRKVNNLSELSDSSSVIMKVTVTFPKAVDFANTMNTDGNTATWSITKNDLARGVELRAITLTE